MLHLLREPWAIRPEYAPQIASQIVAGWLAGMQAGADVGGSPVMQDGQIAVMKLFGTMTQHSAFFGTGMDRFGRAFDQLVADPNIAAIIIEANTPGGTVSGTEELAAKIANARGTKPVIAHGNSMIASAGWWVTSAADSISLSPGGEIGSQGVLMIHEDWSKRLGDIGIKVTMMAMPPAKIEGNPFEPLTDEARAHFEAQNQVVYEKFVKAVAKNRGVSQVHAREKFGGGRMLLAEEALAAGMIDRIETLDQLVGRLRKKTKARNNYAATNALALAAAADD